MEKRPDRRAYGEEGGREGKECRDGESWGSPQRRPILRPPPRGGEEGERAQELCESRICGIGT